MAERLTTLAKRLRPFIAGMVGNMASGGAFVTEGPGIDIVGQTVGLGGDTILLYDSSGSPVAEYAASAAGLTAALGAATTGDIVIIDYPGTITGDFSIPATVMLTSHSRYQVTIVGQVTLNDDSTIYNLTVANQANSAAVIYGVVGPVTGSANIMLCDVSARQAGAGNAYAIGATRGASLNNGNLVVQDCYLFGDSTGGDGYAARSLRGKVEIWHSRAYGSTARYITS